MAVVALVLFLITAIPSIILYWPFVHKVVGGSFGKSLVLATACQFVSFLTSLLVLVLTAATINPFSWNLNYSDRDFWSSALIIISQMSLVPPIAAFLGLWIVQRRTLRDGVLLWAGHMLSGAIVFTIIVLICSHKPNAL